MMNGAGLLERKRKVPLPGFKALRAEDILKRPRNSSAHTEGNSERDALPKGIFFEVLLPCSFDHRSSDFVCDRYTTRHLFLSSL